MTREDEKFIAQQYAAAKAVLMTTLAQARAGNFSGIADVDKSLDTLVNLQPKLYANSTDYEREFGRTKNIIQEIESLADDQLKNSEQELSSAQATNDESRNCR
jgi:hypothetical protein